VHVYASVTKQCNLIQAQGWWCWVAWRVATGLAESNVSLSPGLLLMSFAGYCLQTGINSEPCVLAISMNLALPFPLLIIYCHNLDEISSLFEVNITWNFLQYATSPLLRGLYGKAGERADVEMPDGIYVLEENRLVGSPRLRMLRVRNDSCNVHLDFREFIHVCYDVYSSDSEDREPFNLANGSA